MQHNRIVRILGIIGAWGLALAACSNPNDAQRVDVRRPRGAGDGIQAPPIEHIGQAADPSAGGTPPPPASPQPGGEAPKDTYFLALVTAADEVKEPTSAEFFASLNFTKHAERLKNGHLKPQGAAAELKGRCLLFAGGAQPFADEDTNASPKVELSPAGRLAASVSQDLSPKACDDFFREVMGERYLSEFFAVYTSFYAVSGN